MKHFTAIFKTGGEPYFSFSFVNSHSLSYFSHFRAIVRNPFFQFYEDKEVPSLPLLQEHYQAPCFLLFILIPHGIICLAP